ncbi:MAG: polysaccharide biosynthesis tyrosine autokinase [bacterium]
MSDQSKASASDALCIGDIYYLLFRHKGKILAFIMLGVIAAAAVFVLTPPVYRSEASLLVRYVTDTTVLDSASMGERITSPARGGENVINSEIEILLSHDLVEKVLDDMGFSQFMPTKTNRFDRARTASKIRSRLSIEVPKSSNIINISFDGPDPSTSQEFLKRLTEAYLQKHIEIHRAAGAYEFLSEQTDQLRARLSETEEELRKLKYSEGVVSVEDTKKSISHRMEELTRQLGELESSSAAAKARVEVMGSVRPNTGPGQTSIVWVTTTNNVTARSLETKLQRERQRESELLSVYTADSIPVKSLREQIAETERQLSGEAPSPVTNSMMSGVSAPEDRSSLIEAQANMAELQARIAVHKDILVRTVDEARRIDAVESKIVQLERSKELREANYKYFCQSLEHARIDEALNSGRISNIGIVQPATLPSEKLRVKLPQNMAIALFLGIMGGLSLAVFKEYFLDQTLRKPAEVKAALRVPLLMTMPWAKEALQFIRVGQRGALELPSARERDRVAHDHSEPAGQIGLNDYFEVLRERLMTEIGIVPSVPCVLGVTSCARGAGVSTVAAGLALAFARSGDHRVVLVNGDSDTMVPQIFGVNPVTGLTEMLADAEGNTAVTQHNHYVVPSRDTVSPFSSSGSAAHFGGLIQYLRNSQAGFVIVDLPPVSETSLTLRVGRMLDGVVMVIAAEKVNRHVAEHVKELLVRSDAKIIGAILNMQRQYVPEWVCPMC